MSLAASACLTGCVGVRFSPQPSATAAPAAFLRRDVARQPGCLSLAAGASPPAAGCWLAVQAESADNDSGLRLGLDDCVRLQVPSDQLLYDDTRHVPMPEGDDGSEFTHHFASWTKRRTDQRWFALMASLERDDAQARPAVDGSRICGRDLAHTGGEFLPVAHRRRLSFWVNDWIRKYGNNHGRIWLLITPA